MICTVDDTGHTIWISTRHSELVSYLPELRDNGERGVIVQRRVRAFGAATVVFVMRITKLPVPA